MYEIYDKHASGNLDLFFDLQQRNGIHIEGSRNCFNRLQCWSVSSAFKISHKRPVFVENVSEFLLGNASLLAEFNEVCSECFCKTYHDSGPLPIRELPSRMIAHSSQIPTIDQSSLDFFFVAFLFRARSTGL